MVVPVHLAADNWRSSQSFGAIPHCTRG